MLPHSTVASILLTSLAAASYAQNFSQSLSPSVTISGSAVQNPALFSTPFVLNVEDTWDLLIGPVQEAYYTTTVSPTPIPSESLIPPPPLYYSPFPTGQQVPAEIKNESWSFPKDFAWGVAGAAYQIEGGVKAEGRGPSVWDRLTHIVGYTVNNYTADVTNNDYFMYKEDISRIAAMGVKAYSFTLSWSRILPFGRGPVNQLAIAHYNDVIDTCMQYNITPIVTIYHWDTPLALQDKYGGWLSEEIVGDFVEYARIAFTAFGDRVKWWYTVNEPIVFCNQYPFPAQCFKNFSIPNAHQPWLCGQSVLLAHSQAYHLGKRLIPGNSTIAYKNNGGYKIPLTNSSADAEAVQRAWDFNEGWFSDPIYLTGDYPAAVKNYTASFLRPFTPAEQRAIKGSADHYAHDAYTSQFYFAPSAGIASCIADPTNPLYPSCANTSYTYSPADGGWDIGPAADPLAPWLHKATDWVPAFMRYLKDTWADPAGALPIAITEVGFAEPFEAEKKVLGDILFDPIRSSYFRDYTRAVLMSLAEGVNIIGLLAWSFVDNFEWQSGFAVRFGMQYCNFSDPELPRYYKASFFEFSSAFDIYQEK